MASVDKKLGRRVAGSYGRPGSNALKRAAHKGTRREAKRSIVEKANENRNCERSED